MEKNELADLIPLYVTGKVSDEQKAAIERALPDSKELRDEVAFWRKARFTSQKEAVFLGAGHLTSERIVDYARGAISNPLEKSDIEQHLQTCKLCSNDLETIKPAFAVPSPAFFRRPIQEVLRSLGKLLVPGQGSGRGLRVDLRPIYALPFAAVLIVFGVIIYQLSNPTAHSVSFALQFQTQDRSSGTHEIQTLSLQQKVGVVHLSVPIPHATLQPSTEDIALTLSPPGEKRMRLNHGLSWSVGSLFDTAKVEVASSSLQTAGIYTLHAAIRYASASSPFEYNYRFNVVLEE